jgi:hypothetical protein
LQQLLWIETILKLSAGLLLGLAPRTTLTILGLPRTETGFWPRLLGALLIGLGAATFLEGAAGGGRGLGLEGCVLINFSGASMMAALLLLDAGPASARGRAVMWTLVILLILLCVLEIANF